MTFAELEELDEEELLPLWDAFASHCEDRDKQIKAQMAERAARMPRR